MVNQQKIKQIIKNLEKISWKEWEQVVKQEPEWKVFKEFLKRNNFSSLAVFSILVGLNAFQLKGKAEDYYWEELFKLISDVKFSSLKDFYKLLRPFYQKERLNKLKISRMKKFLNSELSKKLFRMKPAEISKSFVKIWEELAREMGQRENQKTISFAMKCLGCCLIMKGINDFEFLDIIPVDSRVRRITYEFFGDISDKEIQKIWEKVIISLRRKHPYIKMIHLDSLIWQEKI